MSGAIVFFEAFHFLRPFWLVTLLPALGVWWSFRHRADGIQAWRRVIAPELLVHLIAPGTKKVWLRPIDVLLITWLVGIVAVAGPAWTLAPPPFAEDSPPVMIVLKVTPSMSNHDLPPNRLERAQEKIADLLRLQPSQAAGLIAYAGSSHLVLPPTHDASIVVSMAQALAPDIMPKPGDNLAGAIELASKVLADGENGGSILVLADDVAPGQIAKLQASEQGRVPVSLLAMVPRNQENGPALRLAARAMKARLMVATVDASDVAAIGKRLATTGYIVSRPREARRWRDMGWYLVPLLAIVVLLWFRRGWVVAG
jgi:Ca-activated chloride channel homolog